MMRPKVDPDTSIRSLPFWRDGNPLEVFPARRGLFTAKAAALFFFLLASGLAGCVWAFAR